MKSEYNVLFLCSANTARSQLAESIANHLGRGRFRAYSAGSRPATQVHPQALALLTEIGFPTEDLAPKSWTRFAEADAPVMDLIITLCDRTAGEPCPTWPGHPITAHWNVPDPVRPDATAEQGRAAFQLALQVLQQRIALMLALPLASLDRLALETRVADLGSLPPGEIA